MDERYLTKILQPLTSVDRSEFKEAGRMLYDLMILVKDDFEMTEVKQTRKQPVESTVGVEKIVQFMERKQVKKQTADDIRMALRKFVRLNSDLRKQVLQKSMNVGTSAIVRALRDAENTKLEKFKMVRLGNNP